LENFSKFMLSCWLFLLIAIVFVFHRWCYQFCQTMTSTLGCPVQTKVPLCGQEHCHQGKTVNWALFSFWLYQWGLVSAPFLPCMVSKFRWASERTKIWVWVLVGTETKNNFAREGQQQFTAMLYKAFIYSLTMRSTLSPEMSANIYKMLWYHFLEDSNLKHYIFHKFHCFWTWK
jgi:hypothetical protein